MWAKSNLGEVVCASRNLSAIVLYRLTCVWHVCDIPISAWKPKLFDNERFLMLFFFFLPCTQFTWASSSFWMSQPWDCGSPSHHRPCTLQAAGNTVVPCSWDAHRRSRNLPKCCRSKYHCSGSARTRWGSRPWTPSCFPLGQACCRSSSCRILCTVCQINKDHGYYSVLVGGNPREHFSWLSCPEMLSWTLNSRRCLYYFVSLSNYRLKCATTPSEHDKIRFFFTPPPYPWSTRKHSTCLTELKWRHQVLWGACHIPFKGWLGLLVGLAKQTFMLWTVVVCVSDIKSPVIDSYFWSTFWCTRWEVGMGVGLPSLSVFLIDLQGRASGRSAHSCWSPSSCGSRGILQGQECTGNPCRKASHRPPSAHHWHGWSCNSWSA